MTPLYHFHIGHPNLSGIHEGCCNTKASSSRSLLPQWASLPPLHASSNWQPMQRSLPPTHHNHQRSCTSTCVCIEMVIPHTSLVSEMPPATQKHLTPRGPFHARPHSFLIFLHFSAAPCYYPPSPDSYLVSHHSSTRTGYTSCTDPIVLSHEMTLSYPDHTTRVPVSIQMM